MSLNRKLQNDIESTSASKLLVICVDRDDDIGKKAGITSPVVGRNACLEAAQRLALEDPEDDDSRYGTWSGFAALSGKNGKLPSFCQ